MENIDNLLSGVFSGVSMAENADAVNDMLDKYGLNWKVEKEKLVLPDGTETPFYGVVRQDTRKTFQACKEGYTPFQNSELSEMLIRLSEKTGYEIHSGGLFNGGAKVYLQLVSPNKIQGIGSNNDTVDGFLTGLNTHDGSSALKWGETNITVSCRNTFMAAMKALKNKARHTLSIKNMVEISIREITGIVESEKSMFDEFIKLSEIPVDQKSIAKVVKRVTEVDINLSTEQLKKEHSSKRVTDTNDLLASIAKEMKQKGDTMWGLFSGVTRYTTHSMSVPNRDNARLESIYTGSGYKKNNEAYAEILEMAGV